eukprot:10991893-Ditylum_brightwellii.AAC.1
MIRSAWKAISLEPQSTKGYLMLATAHINIKDAEMAVDAIESRLAKDNKNVELNRLVLEYDGMLSDIMAKCKKQRYSKSVRNINQGNGKKQWGNNNNGDGF